MEDLRECQQKGTQNKTERKLLFHKATVLLNSFKSRIEKFEQLHNDKDQAGDAKKDTPLFK